MWLSYLGIAITFVLMVVYLVCMGLNRPNLAKFFKYLATLNVIMFILVLMLYLNNPGNIAYMFFVLASIFALDADMALEEKNRPKTGDFMLKSAATLCAIFKLCIGAAFLYIIRDSFDLAPLLYSVIIAVVSTVVIMIVLKYVLKMYFREQLLNIIVYFLISTYLTTLTIWYSTLIPGLWAFTVFIALIFLNDLLLININFLNTKKKTVLFNAQRISYFVSLMFLLVYLYSSFITFV